MTLLDAVPAAKARPAGRPATHKAMLALSAFAVLAAAAFVADILVARQGLTPAGGFDHIDDRADARPLADGSPRGDLSGPEDDGAGNGSVADGLGGPGGTDADARQAGDPLTAIASTTSVTSSGWGSQASMADLSWDAPDQAGPQAPAPSSAPSS